MKKYLSFNLKGEEIFKYIIFLILLIAIPSLIFLSATDWGEKEDLGFFAGFIFVIVFLVVFLGALAISLYIYKISIENVEFDGERLSFSGTFGEFSGIILKGAMLTIITLSIYLPWFLRDFYSYLIGETSYRDTRFKFLGKGKELFIIYLLALVLPLIILGLIFNNFSSITEAYNFQSYLVDILESIVIAPFVYFYYRWLIDLSYGDYKIKFRSETMEGIGAVLLQLLLTAVTWGIYYPVAILKIYQYYLKNTDIRDESGSSVNAGYDLDAVNDFLYIWGQTLLSLITIGIYIPWAYCRVMNRVLGKTYLESA